MFSGASRENQSLLPVVKPSIYKCYLFTNTHNNSLILTPLIQLFICILQMWLKLSVVHPAVFRDRGISHVTHNRLPHSPCPLFPHYASWPEESDRFSHSKQSVNISSAIFLGMSLRGEAQEVAPDCRSSGPEPICLTVMKGGVLRYISSTMWHAELRYVRACLD